MPAGFFGKTFPVKDRPAELCCAVLCCAVLCCAVLCCAVLCCAARQHAGKRRQLPLAGTSHAVARRIATSLSDTVDKNKIKMCFFFGCILSQTFGTSSHKELREDISRWRTRTTNAGVGLVSV